MHPAIWIAVWLVLGVMNMHNAVKSAKGTHTVPFFNSVWAYVFCLFNVGLCSYNLGIEVMNLWL